MSVFGLPLVLAQPEVLIGKVAEQQQALSLPLVRKVAIWRSGRPWGSPHCRGEWQRSSGWIFVCTTLMMGVTLPCEWIIETERRTLCAFDDPGPDVIKHMPERDQGRRRTHCSGNDGACTNNALLFTLTVHNSSCQQH